jgi:hypothetical protein
MALVNHGLQDLLLLLPASLRDRAEEMASRECVSLNLFVVMAVAEKLQRLQLQQCLEITDEDKLKLNGTADSPPLLH